MAISTAVVVGEGVADAGAVAAVAGAAAAADAATTGITIAEIAQGATIIGGVTSLVGAVTGNKTLSMIGGIVGLAGGVGGIIDGLTSAAVDAGSAGITAADEAAATSLEAESNVGADVAQGATGAASSDTAALASAGGNAGQANTAVNGAINTTGATAESAPDSALVQSNMGEVAPNSLSTPISATPSPQGGATAPGSPNSGIIGDNSVVPNAQQGGLLHPGQSLTAEPAGAGTETTGGGGGSLLGDAWHSFRALPLKDQIAALQVGSGVVGGISKYLAPDPMDKATIAEKNAQTAALQQQTSMTASRAANLASATSKPGGWFGQAGVNAPQIQTGPIGQPMQAGNLAVSPANPMSMNNNPYATPGLLQAAQNPGGV